MRKNHKPYWLQLTQKWLNIRYVKRYLLTAFDESGEGIYAINPRHIEISGPKITVGKHVHFMALPDKPVRLANFEGLGEIHIGDYSIVNPGVRMSSASSIQIGHSCMFAMNAYISDADWHDLHHRIYAPGKTKPIVIKDNVWIGDSALVCKGVTIGENSVVGAYSVVTKDVPANTVVAGNPAVIVGKIDDSHLTKREYLFNMSEPYSRFEANYEQTLLKGNYLGRWLRTYVWPTKRD